MHKLCLIYLTMLSLFLSWNACGEEKRYISDKLKTYIYSEPSNQSDIVGTLSAGDEVILLNVDQATRYGQIRDNKGRIAWITLDQLNQSSALRSRSAALEQQVKILTTKLANSDNSWNSRMEETQQKMAASEAALQQKVSASSNIIAQLQQENATLKNQLVAAQKTTAQKKVSMVDLLQDKTKHPLIYQWFMYGGGVAGLGLLLGLMLPYFVPTRKRSDRWMN